MLYTPVIGWVGEDGTAHTLRLDDHEFRRRFPRGCSLSLLRCTLLFTIARQGDQGRPLKVLENGIRNPTQFGGCDVKGHECALGSIRFDVGSIRCRFSQIRCSFSQFDVFLQPEASIFSLGLQVASSHLSDCRMGQE